MTQEVQENSVELDSKRKDLKIQALKERIAELVAEYEDRDANRRVLITELNEMLEATRAEVARLNHERAESDGTKTETADAPV